MVQAINVCFFYVQEAKFNIDQMMSPVVNKAATSFAAKGILVSSKTYSYVSESNR